MISQSKTFNLNTSLLLESGAKLKNVSIAYETFGELNKDRSNAILICHALTGNSHVCSSDEDSSEGWWEKSVGPNKAIDTNTYFVICSNVLGSCKGSTGPASINPETNEAYGLSFPVFTITDIVSAQAELISFLKIQTLYAVVGPSMGGMQALTWSIKFADRLKKCIIIASSSSLSPQAIAFGTVGRNAIISDSNFNKGNYSDKKPEIGLSIARMIGHITYLSKESITQKFGRRLQKKSDYGYQHSLDFQVESYLKHQGEKFVDYFDANSYLYLSKALSYFDLEKQFGSLKNAFKQTKASLLFVSISSDWLYPTDQTKQMVAACMNLNKHVTFCEVTSDYGHDAFLIENEKFDRLIGSFLGTSS